MDPKVSQCLECQNLYKPTLFGMCTPRDVPGSRNSPGAGVYTLSFWPFTRALLPLLSSLWLLLLSVSAPSLHCDLGVWSCVIPIPQPLLYGFCQTNPDQIKGPPSTHPSSVLPSIQVYRKPVGSQYCHSMFDRRVDTQNSCGILVLWVYLLTC